MSYLDLRLGGIPRYHLSEASIMLVPDEIRQCVAFIGFLDGAGIPQMCGTVFFVASELTDLGVTDRAAMFLVTAQHVIDGIKENGGRAVIRVNMRGDKARWFELPATEFHSHPNHPKFESVDAAVAGIGVLQNIDNRAIPTAMFVTEERIKNERIGVGDEVFVSGLFWNHHGRERNLPIVRIGNIAGMPEEKVETKNYGLIDAYLVEARSIGGLSGSPVFVHLGLVRVVDEKLRFAKNTDFGIYYLLGLMQGHWHRSGPDLDGLPQDDASRREQVNTGIAIVTPISKVVEIMNRPELKAYRQRVADAAREERENDLPVADVLPTDHTFTRDDFEQALKKVARKLPDSGTSQTSDE